MSLDPRDAFWIRNSYLGSPENDDITHLEPQAESIAIVAAFLVERRCGSEDALRRADALLYEAEQMRIDDVIGRGVTEAAVRRAACDALSALAALTDELNAKPGNRLFAAVAKAAALRTTSDPELMAISGLDRINLEKAMDAVLTPLRGALEDVVEAHSLGQSGGNFGRERQAEFLAGCVNHYVSALNRHPTITTGDRPSDFVAFANLIAAEVGAVFTERDFKNLRDRLPPKAI